MVLNNQRGQSVVEYMLLFAVAISLVMTFYRSSTFRNLFGEQGKLGIQIKNDSEIAYRHGMEKITFPESIDREVKNASAHPSYTTPNGTRFFGAKEPYQ